MVDDWFVGGGSVVEMVGKSGQDISDVAAGEPEHTAG